MMAMAMERGMGFEDGDGNEEEEEVVLFARKKRKKEGEEKNEKQRSGDDDGHEDLGMTRKETVFLLLLTGFAKLGLSEWLVQSCESMGMKQPTPIQMNCIEPTLKGMNILGSAQTGSGKTAAFALPILETLAQNRFGVYAVVMTPTRELAFQISEQFLALGSPIRVRCEVVVGGMSMLHQSLKLASRPHVVVATPGRLAQLIRGPEPPYLKLAKFLVLDEADRLIADSFADDLRTIMQSMSKSRQTLLYSATMTTQLEELKNVARSTSSKPLFEYHASSKASTVDTVDERYLLVPDQVKHVYMAHIVRVFGPISGNSRLKESDFVSAQREKRRQRRRRPRDVVVVDEEGTEEQEAVKAGEESEAEEPQNEDRAKLMIMFVSTCETCQLLCETLLELGIDSAALHSRTTQNRRLAALGKFRSGVVSVLVATDVASRGLDIPKVELVLNYDVPRDPDDYIHRAGRTARAGRVGRVITLVSQYDVKRVLEVEKRTGKKLQLLPGVEEEEVLVLLTRVTNAMQVAKLRIVDTGMDEQLRRAKARKRAIQRGESGLIKY